MAMEHTRNQLPLITQPAFSLRFKEQIGNLQFFHYK